MWTVAFFFPVFVGKKKKKMSLKDDCVTIINGVVTIRMQAGDLIPSRKHLKSKL